MIKQKVIPMKKKGKGWFGDPEGHARAASMRKSHGPKKAHRGGQRELIYYFERLLLAIEFEHPDMRLPELKAAKQYLKTIKE